MTPVEVLLDEGGVNGYLIGHGLESGHAPLRALLLQLHGTMRGAPAVMIVVEVDGKKVLAKTSLALLETATVAMRAAVGRETT